RTRRALDVVLRGRDDAGRSGVRAVSRFKIRVSKASPSRADARPVRAGRPYLHQSEQCGTPVPTLPESSMPLTMFLQYAAVHHHEDSGFPRFLCRGLMFHFLLHPDAGNAELNGLVDKVRHKLRAAKDVYDVDLLGDIEQRGIR